ncbi:MAG: hypothetical protein WBC73_17165 [Phormidesmis sp.]
MSQRKLKRLQQLGVMMLGAYVITGCPSKTANSIMLSDSDALSQGIVAQETVVQEAAAPASIAEETVAQSVGQSAVTPVAIAFEVCADVDRWQRPSEAEQAKQIGGDARYTEALSGDLLKSASNQFWDHQVISFTTYGLSARLEPINLSGVWTVADDLWDCYEAETAIAINAGDRAETWLLNQRISSLEWQGDRYVMTVAPAETGMQVVQFDRVDGLASLPLEVITESGEPVEAISGDWQ